MSRRKDMQYLRVFRKKDQDGDFYRYWGSVSTEKVDKEGKGTGEYARASIPVRLSQKAQEVFKDNAEKTKSKGTKQLNAKVEGWLKAAEPKEGNPYVYMFIDTIEPIQNNDDDDEEDE